jgi:benzoyl-CoA reductase/2-hydroxyglutaryl-CoA dehydratase subunit BcrC/BadD/HgdB
LIKGASLDHTAFHRLIERQGGFVVAEDDWRGSRAAGDLDIRTDCDPVVAIFEKYFYDTVSPRVQPFDEADAWLHRSIEGTGVDGVIFYIPLDDDVLGWDYPRQLAYLRQRKVPSLLVRESAATESSSGLEALVLEFVERLRRG